MKAYVVGESKEKTLLYITGASSSVSSAAPYQVSCSDIFGYELNNARLLADEYAKGIGFRVVMPDFFDVRSASLPLPGHTDAWAKGDYVPHTLLKSIAPQKSDPEPGVLEKATETAKVGASLGPWLAKHREAVSRPKVEAAAKALLEDEGVKRVGVVGVRRRLPFWPLKYD